MSGSRFPNLGGPLDLDAAENAVGVGTKASGALAQVSGAALGFDLFTPTADGTYVLLVRVQDVASGSPSHCTVDIVTLTAIGGWAPTKMVTSVTNVGTCATTYSNNSGALRLAVGSGVTWYADVVILARFPA
ncbi:MAG: hypothetical protein H3C62_17550 [Gemmatimonadaceae bacterium]|nr:hypothetical protein [Gemmatimonadaceae bacterium]